MAQSPEQLGAVASYRPYAQTFGEGAPKQLLLNQVSDQYHGTLGSTKGSGLTGHSLLLPGTNGNYASTLDSAAFNVSDLDIRVRLKLSTLTPSNNQTIVARWGDGALNQRSWCLQQRSAGGFRLLLSTNGAAFSNEVRSDPIPFTAQDIVYIRVVRPASTGVTSYSWSTDGETWTAMGSGTSSAYSPAPVAYPIEVGAARGGAADQFAGRIYSVEVRSGIDGPIIASPRFDQQPAGTGQFADDQGNVWTIHASAADTNDPVFTGTGLAFIADDRVERPGLQIAEAAFTVFLAATVNSTTIMTLYSEGNSGSDGPLLNIRTGVSSGSNAYLHFRDDSGTNLIAAESTAPVFDQTPHTLAVTMDGTGQWAIYVDGRLDSQGAYTPSITTFNRATIGALGRTVYNNYLTGTIHALDNFQAVLRSDQIAQLHEYYRQQLATVGVDLPPGPPGDPTSTAGLHGGISPQTAVDTDVGYHGGGHLSATSNAGLHGG